MNSKHLTISTALLFMFAGTVGTAEARNRNLHCTTSGTFADGVETNIDTNDDGTSAVLDQGIANCGGGRFFFQEEAEWIPSGNTTCPQGSNEYHIDETTGQQRSVDTDEKTGDQLFTKITSATLCVNFSSTPFLTTTSGQGEYIGGTGKFTGATGTNDFQTTGSYLIFGFKNGVFGGFGQFTGTVDATLTLPKGNKN